LVEDSPLLGVRNGELALLVVCSSWSETKHAQLQLQLSCSPPTELTGLDEVEEDRLGLPESEIVVRVVDERGNATAHTITDTSAPVNHTPAY
jgi:hypothetical protein